MRKAFIDGSFSAEAPACFSGAVRAVLCGLNDLQEFTMLSLQSLSRALCLCFCLAFKLVSLQLSSILILCDIFRRNSNLKNIFGCIGRSRLFDNTLH